MGGMAPEAPHIYKKGGRYYLLIAEGATEFGHCATLAAARAIWGPYTPCPTNPVLRAASHTSLFQTVGHGV
jgi:xylan 1,4-beta-xylosidase